MICYVCCREGHIFVAPLAQFVCTARVVMCYACLDIHLAVTSVKAMISHSSACWSAPIGPAYYPRDSSPEQDGFDWPCITALLDDESCMSSHPS